MSIFKHFQTLNLSKDQETALQMLEKFLHGSEQVFMLKGYAGSGKTTILKGLVEYLSSIDRDFALMAPTGRAAKVIRERTGQEAYTVHKSIYSYDNMEVIEDGESVVYHFKISNNVNAIGKVYIVDEASMLADGKSEGEFYKFGTGHLLSDLFTYSRVNIETIQSKIIFVGDPCQLPPVSDSTSLAFDASFLTEKFGVNVIGTEMKEVMRVGSESGILQAASKIRKSITSGQFNDFNLKNNNQDIFNPSYADFIETWKNAKSPKIIIAYKNKTCLELNRQIREDRFGAADLPLQKAEIIILGSNNYNKEVFNGEFDVVSEVSDILISRTIKLTGKPEVTLTWRDVELVFPEADSKFKIVKGKILENFLYGDNVLTPIEWQALYVDFLMRHKDIKPKTEAFKQAILNDEYFNCLMIKYGYAVTCHKAQGGEWANVFTLWDHEKQEGFDCFRDKQLKRSKDNVDFFRWAYTAITRASEKLYALNPPIFNSFSSMTFVDNAVQVAMDELSGTNVVPQEVNIGEDILNAINMCKLTETQLQLQDHFIKAYLTLKEHNIEVTAWEKKGYEILYHIRKDSNYTVVKTWINAEFVFNGKFMQQPIAGNSLDLYNTASALLCNMPNMLIIRDTPETIVSKLEFEFNNEEQFPCTRNLYDAIKPLLDKKAINIENIEHLQYKERYTLIRNGEKAVIDFEYNLKGFFGRVFPLAKHTNSQKLLDDIKNELTVLIQMEHA